MRPAPSAIAHASPRHCVCLSSSLLSVPRDKSAVIARRHAEAIQCGSLSKTGLPRFLAEPRNDSENANPSVIAHANPSVIARRHAEAIQCGSLSKTGLPRFLTEPRNDSENANPSSLRTPFHVIAMRKHLALQRLVIAIPPEGQTGG